MSALVEGGPLGLRGWSDLWLAVPTDAAQHLLVDGAVLPIHLLVLDLLSPLLAHGRSRLTGCLPTGLKRRRRHALALQALQVGIAGNADLALSHVNPACIRASGP